MIMTLTFQKQKKQKSFSSSRWGRLSLFDVFRRFAPLVFSVGLAFQTVEPMRSDLKGCIYSFLM